jgi:molybdopterin molybdotransferase
LATRNSRDEHIVSDLISLVEAVDFVLGSCRPMPAVEVEIDLALGCVLAEEIVALYDVPSFANSAMDGFAVIACDVGGAEATLRVIGTALAGHSFPGRVGKGEAVRIMTGAVMPKGADTVCVVEQARPGADVDTVVLEGPSRRGDHVRHPGEDVRQGDLVFQPGTVLGPPHLGVLAGLGHAIVRVHGRPRVGVLSTGDELVGAAEALRPGMIRDSNRPGLIALVRNAGFAPVDLGIAPDDHHALTTRLHEAALRCDAILVSGGVSVGDADLVKMVLEEECGESMRWMQIAIKPAKPFAFGLRRTSGTPLFGLPGNPVSAMVSFELLARPALRRMAGHADVHRARLSAIADEPLVRRPDGKIHFARVVARVGAEGLIHVRSAGSQASHVLSAMAEANALAVLADGPGPSVGDPIEVLLLDADGLGAEFAAGQAVDR